MEAVVGKLLEAMSSPNSVVPEDVAALVFTLQDDLGPINPAAAARSLGYSNVPLLMVREHGGDTRVGRCLRALMLVNTTLSQAQVRHAYLGGAAALRPDLAAGERL
jgi:chorismate mutase